MDTMLTFGVEFEMSIVLDGPIDSLEKRITHIEPKKERYTWQTIANHTAMTLKAACFYARVMDPKEEGDFTAWVFKPDASIQPPYEDPNYDEACSYLGIELCSPALYFTPESLKAVDDVLALLTSTYRINTNPSTGLHVHVGDSRKGWPYHTVQKVVAFAWAFEPQIDSLVPPHRIDNSYASSIRRNSRFVHNFIQRTGRRPTALEGLEAIMKCQTEDELTEAFTSGAVRYDANAAFLDGFYFCKPTIEFRYHDGTMDSVRVRMWIRTVVGIMHFLRAANPSVLMDLFSIVEHERWVKMGDGHDDERESGMGPILAEGGFTCIDLLRTMGLYVEAKYYKQRGIYKHARVHRLPGAPADGFYWVDLQERNSGAAVTDTLEGVRGEAISSSLGSYSIRCSSYEQWISG